MPRAFDQGRRRFLGTPAATFAGIELAMFGATKSLLHAVGTAADRGLAALRRATTWLNSPPLTADRLHGKVVLVDFCTYTYINWLRTLPYMRAWAEKYHDRGLVVIGVAHAGVRLRARPRQRTACAEGDARGLPDRGRQ